MKQSKSKKERIVKFPNWVLWISLVSLSIKEILRFISPNWSETFFLPIIFLFIFLFIPASCVWGIIRDKIEKIKYPSWVLWGTFVVFIINQMDYVISFVYLSYKNSVLMGYPINEIIAVMVGSIGSAIFVSFFVIFIPAYCMKKIIELRRNNSKV